MGRENEKLRSEREAAAGEAAAIAAKAPEGSAIGEAMARARLPGESQRAYRERMAQQEKRNANQPRPDTTAGQEPAATQAAKAGAEVSAEALDIEANKAASSPTNALPLPSKEQIEANNAKLGHPKIAGLDISIENPEGSVREDKGSVPPKWRAVRG